VTVYTAIRWTDDGDCPEVYLHEGLWEAIEWLLDFPGTEDIEQENLDHLKEQLGRIRQVDLDQGIHLQVLPLRAVPL